MAGHTDRDVAARLGTILGTIHNDGPSHPELAGPSLADTSLFDELRIDPYYRTIARGDPDLAPRIDELIASMERPADGRTLVLGDFSPKNILVHSRGLTLLDFECAHAGDAAFDLGFFLSHLVLKTIRKAPSDPGLAARYAALCTDFLSAYLDRRGLPAAAQADLVRRTCAHTAACCWARVDGKSPVEYLSAHGRSVARSFGRETLRAAPQIWEDLQKLLALAIGGGTTCQPSRR
jgi:5-methylthioribose kinase